MERLKYVASCIEGRVRLRHPVFATTAGIRAAEDVFRRHAGIRSVEHGTSSFLVFFDPSFRFETVCRELEEALPVLASGQKTTGSGHPVPVLSCVNMRKAEVRCLLGTLLGTTILGFAGSGRAHVWLGTAFLVLSLWHVWERRRAM